MFWRKQQQKKVWKTGNYGYVTLGRRARAAVTLIEPGSSVLDVGCGPMLLRQHLPEGCTYAGYDFEPISDEVGFVDLDKRQFPEGQWDYIVLLGVLSWIKEQEWTLEAARKVAGKLVITNAEQRLLPRTSAAGWKHEKTITYHRRKLRTWKLSLFR